MCALNDLIRIGKLRYIGACGVPAWQLQKANHIAEMHGWNKFVCVQVKRNLLYREEEREMVPFCIDQGIGLVHFSPLCMGLLTGKGRKTTRSDAEESLIKQLFNERARKNNQKILERVEELALRKSIKPVQACQHLYS